VWVRLKDERRRVDVVDYCVYAPVLTRDEMYVLLGALASGGNVELDCGRENEMNARFDEMAAYQDKSAYFKSGVMWCYDMNTPVGEAQGKVSKE
jgi:hypothetical protein